MGNLEFGDCYGNICNKDLDKIDFNDKKEPKKFTCLYEKYGGHETISKIVDKFYESVKKDDIVNNFFNEINMKKQAQHQTNFISFCLGGPNKYTGRTMREAHAGLGLTDLEFNSIVRHLEDTLKYFGVEKDDIKEIMKIVASTHDDILGL